LDSVLEKQREEERLRKEMDGEEVKSFRQAVAARETEANKPPMASSTNGPTSAVPSKSKSTAPIVKKDAKKTLKGVLVKKKAKPSIGAATTQETSPTVKEPKRRDTKTDIKADGNAEPQAKRRKMT